MKNTLLYLLLLINYGTLFGQVENATENKGATTQEQVYVHTDRNLYSPGDTIYFQAYIKNLYTGGFNSVSKSLYALLLNQQNEVVDSSRFKIDACTAPGWTVIPKDLKPGTYRFVAFTSLMQNYDPKNVFKQDIKIVDDLIDPLFSIIAFNKKKYKPGDTVIATVKITNSKKHLFTKQKFICSLKIGKSLIKRNRSKTNNDGISEIRFKLPDTLTYPPKIQTVIQRRLNAIVNNTDVPFYKQNINFKLLPEGGNLIAGIEQRIGFNATDLNGKTIFVEGFLKNKNKQILDTIRSRKYGPGMFRCKPEKGMYIDLTNGNYQKKIWPFPEIKSKGSCLSVVNKNDSQSIVIKVKSTKSNNDNIFLGGIMNSNQVFLKNLKMDKYKQVVLKTENLPIGVMQINLFNKNMQPIAERLVYVNANKRLELKIDTDSIAYIPGNETELTISVSDRQGNPESGIFSIAAVDATTGHAPELFFPGIEHVFNYHPYFVNNLPHKVLKNGLHNLTNEERDLLLMVYGWSKYKEVPSEIDNTKDAVINYDLFNIEMLNPLAFKKTDRGLSLIEINGLSKKSLKTDKKGKITVLFDSLGNEAHSIIMTPNEKFKKKVNYASLSFPSNRKYFESNKLLSPQPIFTGNKFRNSNPPDNNDFLSGKATVFIKEVAVKESAIRKYNDEYHKSYISSRSVGYEKLWAINRLEDAFRRVGFYGSFDNTENTSIRLVAFPILIVLDDIPQYFNGWAAVKHLLPSDLKSITKIGGIEGSSRYGSDGARGVIFVNTLYSNSNPELDKRYQAWLTRNNKDRMFRIINVYRPFKEFYNPSKKEMANNQKLQNRPTIYWNPMVHFDKKPVKIKFPNLAKQGKVMITINGVSKSTLAGSCRLIYPQ